MNSFRFISKFVNIATPWLMFQSNTFCPFSHLRLQQFPRGLGKGSDAALVSAWLQTVMQGMDESMVPVT
jgi:hypothetical protein